jgi:hypothetical protein
MKGVFPRDSPAIQPEPGKSLNASGSDPVIIYSRTDKGIQFFGYIPRGDFARLQNQKLTIEEDA